jgi:hypothetical protein
MSASGNQSYSPKMHSLQANGTIPHPLQPVLLYRRRSSTLPSLRLLPKSTSRRPESLTLCEEVGGAKRWTSSAEEGCGWGHCDCGFVPLLLLSLGRSIEKCGSGVEGDDIQIMGKLDKVPVPLATLALQIVESEFGGSRLSEL